MIKILKENNKTKEMILEYIEGATLLSADEAENLLTQEERKCTYNGGLCWWWLRSPGNSQTYPAFVSYFGSVSYYGCDAADDDGGVRPALILSSNLSGFQVGNVFNLGKYRFEIISSRYALCEQIVERCAFRADLKANDTNVYEESDVKKYIDDWFNDVLEYENQYEQKQQDYKEAGLPTDEELFNVWADW